MTGIRFIPAKVKTFPDEIPDACKYRGSQILARRGTADKTVIDLYIREGRDRPLPTLRLRERLQTVPGGNRPRRTAPADARMGGARAGARPVSALREPPSRRLRRLRIAHERMARHPGSGTERAPKTGRPGARTGDRDRRGRDCGSRQGRDSVRRRGDGRRDRRSLGAGRTGQAGFGRLHGVARRLRKRLRGRGDGRGRPEYVQAGCRASGTGSSDLHSPHEEAGAEASRRDRRVGLGQGEDMAAADGAAAVRRLGASALGARCSGRRRGSSPPLRGAEREVAGAVMPSQAAGRPADEHRGGARDRRKQDKVQDGQGGTKAKTAC